MGISGDEGKTASFFGKIGKHFINSLRGLIIYNLQALHLHGNLREGLLYTTKQKIMIRERKGKRIKNRKVVKITAF